MTESKLKASSINQQKAVDTFHRVNVLVLGGAMFGGKSWLAAMLSTLYAGDPNSRLAVFRKTLQQMRKGGAIIDTFKSVYRLAGDNCKLKVVGLPPVGRIVSGPGAYGDLGDGCKIDFTQMSTEDDMENIRGTAFNLGIIEEAIPDFTQDQIEMILSRLRSNSSEDDANPLGSKLLITCNPDPDHFICDLIKDYYLDDEGYPIQERCGDIRYYGRYCGDYIWGDSKEEVYDILESLGVYTNEISPLTVEQRLERILSFSFVQLTAKDNPIGLKNNPSYMAQLEAMDPVRKARNLYGNWFIRPENSGVFDRKWLRGENGERVLCISDVPKGCVAIRGIDKAHVEPSEVNPNPDFTAISPLILKDRNGFYYLLGHHIPEACDEVKRKSDRKVFGRFRRLAGARDQIIAAQLKSDKELMEIYGFTEPRLVIPKDSGAGTGDYNATLSVMAENGVKTLKDKTISNVLGKKMLDFLGFCNACENHLVYIVEETFDKASLEYMYVELEIFDGETKSTQLRKDDFVDAWSIGFNAAATAKRPYRTIIRNQRKSDTLSAELYRE